MLKLKPNLNKKIEDEEKRRIKRIKKIKRKKMVKIARINDLLVENLLEIREYRKEIIEKESKKTPKKFRVLFSDWFVKSTKKQLGKEKEKIIDLIDNGINNFVFWYYARPISNSVIENNTMPMNELLNLIKLGATKFNFYYADESDFVLTWYKNRSKKYEFEKLGSLLKTNIYRYKNWFSKEAETKRWEKGDIEIKDYHKKIVKRALVDDKEVTKQIVWEMYLFSNYRIIPNNMIHISITGKNGRLALRSTSSIPPNHGVSVIFVDEKGKLKMDTFPLYILMDMVDESKTKITIADLSLKGNIIRTYILGDINYVNMVVLEASKNALLNSSVPNPNKTYERIKNTIKRGGI